MRRILSGRWRNKGVTLITLIIAITIFAIFITVFSYVMVAKHGSAALYVQSTQAYAVAQAGIEYGIRHATDKYIADTTYDYSDFPITKSFENGTFVIDYTPATTSVPCKLKSTGTVGVATREIILRGFVGVVAGTAISLDPNDPPTLGS